MYEVIHPCWEFEGSKLVLGSLNHKPVLSTHMLKRKHGFSGDSSQFACGLKTCCYSVASLELKCSRLLFSSHWRQPLSLHMTLLIRLALHFRTRASQLITTGWCSSYSDKKLWSTYRGGDQVPLSSLSTRQDLLRFDERFLYDIDIYIYYPLRKL